MVSVEIGSMWQYSKGTGWPLKQIDEANSSLACFLACPPVGLIAFTQIISQWPAEETQNTNSSICKPHTVLHWECLCFLAAVRQHHDHHDQRPLCGQCKACAGSDVQAGQQVGKDHIASVPSARVCWVLCCTCCRFALWLHSAGQVRCPWAFNIPWAFTARILTGFCARAFYVMLQMSPLSPAQTFRLLSI